MALVGTNKWVVTVETIDLDDDRRTRTQRTIDAPTSAEARRAALESIVTATHPDAKLRSFAGRAASFLSPTHLIIASYESSDHESMPVAPDGDVTVYDQRTLFTG